MRLFARHAELDSSIRCLSNFMLCLDVFAQYSFIFHYFFGVSLLAGFCNEACGPACREAAKIDTKLKPEMKEEKDEKEEPWMHVVCIVLTQEYSFRFVRLCWSSNVCLLGARDKAYGGNGGLPPNFASEYIALRC